MLRPLDGNTRLFVPEAWNTAVVYFNGSIVQDSNGLFWVSTLNSNLGNTPGIGSQWTPYFGPTTVSKYDPTIAYTVGELVYEQKGLGGEQMFVYVCTESNLVAGIQPSDTQSALFQIGRAHV